MVWLLPRYNARRRYHAAGGGKTPFHILAAACRDDVAALCLAVLRVVRH